MKNIKTFESFNPCDDDPLSRTEEVFGKQTRLQKQFSEIISKGLMGHEDEFWSAFNALKVEILEQVDKFDVEYQELMHRIVEGESPVTVIKDICSKLTQTPEMARLLKKMSNYK